MSRRALVPGLVGLLSAAVALGVAELATAFTRPEAFPVSAVGAVVIDHVPAPVKDFAIATFGTSDKLALIIGILVLLALFGFAIGVAARRSLPLGVAGVALFGAIGVAAAAVRPDGRTADVLPSALGAAAGMIALALLSGTAPRGTGTAPRTAGAGRRPMEPAVGTDRRSFLLAGMGVGALALASGGVGRVLVDQSRVASWRSAVHLPKPAHPAPPLPHGVHPDVPGLASFVTPNRSFYRVDTALVLPHVSPGKWTLRIHGMVDREVELTFDELLRRPMIERDITLTCVSNEVNGGLVGNARWLGFPLADLLREAGVHRDADQILSRSSNGWTCGTPTAVVMDGRDAMLAVGMNGQPLPVAHGFPARMVVPGLYGYVSATKWVVDIELTRFADARAYWAQRGWAVKGPIHTMSRIDRPLSDVRAGRVAVAGVAWAQHRGIERVEVRVDDGPWHDARLAAVPSIDTWRQWVYEWDARPGTHRLQARATDRTGATQTPLESPTVPDGATGWPTVHVTAT
ncbi:MAG: molybdopterin-dependent oxidoreductase [Streptosporangiaceae bacterium]